MQDILKSEKAIFSLVGLVVVAVLFGFGKISQDVWQEMTTWIFTAYIGAKTISSGIVAIKGVTPTGIGTSPSEKKE